MSITRQTTGKILVKLATWVFILGCGPLLVMVLLDWLGFNVSDNPIGLGLLFFVSFPLSLVVFGLGAALGGLRSAANNQEPFVQSTSAIQAPNMGSGTAPNAAANLVPPKPELTSDQLRYIQDNSWGGCWGLIYYLYMNAPQVYFAHLPTNFVYTNIIRNGRQQVWDSGVWTDYDQFVQRNNQIDSFTKPLMLICLGILFFLIFIM